MGKPIINKDLCLNGTNIKLKDLYDGTGVTLNGTYNKMVLFSDDDWWMPQSLADIGATKCLGVSHTSDSKGEFGIGEVNGRCYPYADGHFYQNEGQFRCLDTSDLGNYYFYKYDQFTINDNQNIVTRSWSIQSKGRPIFISITGDCNSTSNGSWIGIRLWKGSNVVAYQIVQSPSYSVNIPFCINYLDITGAGTQSYAIDFIRGAGDSLLGEEGNHQAPQIVCFEI